ncbi:MAG: hypothetical protein KUG75_14040 [Pseudomonadales bacterium]|nr:hypothetical protein [Pseudomonadales bacterium]
MKRLTLCIVLLPPLASLVMGIVIYCYALGTIDPEVETRSVPLSKSSYKLAERSDGSTQR